MDRFDDISGLYRGIGSISGATLTRGQADILWLIGEVERLRMRIKKQAAELRALRAITRPAYMSTESASVREHVPAILPDGSHTMRCICDGRGIVPGPIGGRAEKCPGPESS